MLMADLLKEKGLISEAKCNKINKLRNEYDKELQKKKPNYKKIKTLKKAIGIKIDNHYKVM
jgi:hypothetical protein